MKKRTLTPISQYYLERAKTLGFETVREYHIARGWTSIKDETRIKEYYDEMDPTAVEIPDIPGYFITPMGVICKYNNLKYQWAIIRQQTQKTSYKVFQPYIDGGTGSSASKAGSSGFCDSTCLMSVSRSSWCCCS